ncbi:hypothetical protein BGZ63DRAFT_424471 [Mariannaea sp. PMI_226]|nr:hypothetical protein BGZ63DRAFT_424471 [Mariannaea sp. PMI_226]
MDFSLLAQLIDSEVSLASAHFAQLKHTKYLTNPEETFDIAIIGAPFGNSLGYPLEPRFGLRAIRHMAGQQTSFRGFNPRTGISPAQHAAGELGSRGLERVPQFHLRA